jgi:hypothetical protein
MSEFIEHDVQKVSAPPLVFDPAWVDPATDTSPGPATAWMMAVVGTPNDGDVAVFDAALGYCVWQAPLAATGEPVTIDDGMGGFEIVFDDDGDVVYS